MNDTNGNDNAIVPVENDHRDMISVEQSRTIQEVQASIIIAKKFPRDIEVARQKIMTACQRKSLADKAIYCFPKGRSTVSGPSVKLARVIAQAYGNIDFGCRELTTSDGESVVEAFAWDKESNAREVRTIRIKHEHKAHGNVKKLDDERDIYEHVMNKAQRRVRACILNIIPPDIVEDAVEWCRSTREGSNKEPLIDRVRNLAAAFKKYFGIDVGMIEERLGHSLDKTIESEFRTLYEIYITLKDGMSRREDYFNMGGGSTEAGGAGELNKRFAPSNGDGKKNSKKPKNDDKNDLGLENRE
jgi:hypothetical protein